MIDCLLLNYDDNYVTQVKKDGKFMTFRFDINMHSTYIVNQMSASLDGHEIANWDLSHYEMSGVRIEPKEVVVFLRKLSWMRETNSNILVLPSRRGKRGF